MIPIVLCGGSGARLWPLINQKAFYQFIDKQSLLEITLNRLSKFEKPLIVSVEDQKKSLETALKNHKNIQIVYEPFAKNTAVSIALACFILRRKEEKIVGIFPADHYIEKSSKFQKLLAKGAKLAEKENKIVTLGIVPSRNSSSYGYIKTSVKDKSSDLSYPLTAVDSKLKTISQTQNNKTHRSLNKNRMKNFSSFKARAFIEKPTSSKAKTLIKAGSLWNSGIFISPVGLLIQYFESYLPTLWNKITDIKDIHLSCFESANQPLFEELNFQSARPQTSQEESPQKKSRPLKKSSIKHNSLHSIYKGLKPISFDKGIMENIKDYLCIPCDVGWTDLGSWEKLSEWDQKFPKKLNNKAETLKKNSKGNFIFSSEKKHFALIGIQNQLIINSSGGLLIADKKQLKNIDLKQELYSKKQKNGIQKAWGAERVLMEKNLLKYKELKVNPKSQLSCQRHQTKAKHWIVIKGTAEVLINGKIKKLRPNEHIFINQSVQHQLKNPNSQALLLLEIQIG